MTNIATGVVLGLIAGASQIVGGSITGNPPDAATVLAVAVPFGTFAWYLSGRLTRIEDAVNNLDCKQCPKSGKQDNERKI